jgi:hypothetical protein
MVQTACRRSQCGVIFVTAFIVPGCETAGVGIETQ